MRDDPDHAGVYETETPRRAVDGDSPAEEEAKGGEWFVAPVPSYNPQSEYGLALLGGHIFSLDPDDEATPPSVVAAGGFYTTNGSGGGFGSFKGYLPGDRWRVMAAAGSVGVDYDFYGIGQGEEDLAVPIRTLADFLEVEFLRQLGSAWYLGPSFVTSRTDSRIRTGGLPPGIGADELLLQDTALGLHLQRDTRDDVFYPTSGSLLDAEADFFSTSWGRDGFYYYLSVGQAF